MFLSRETRDLREIRDFFRPYISISSRFRTTKRYAAVCSLFYEQLHFWVQARVANGFPCFQPQSCSWVAKHNISIVMFFMNTPYIQDWEWLYKLITHLAIQSYAWPNCLAKGHILILILLRGAIEITMKSFLYPIRVR